MGGKLLARFPRLNSSVGKTMPADKTMRFFKSIFLVLLTLVAIGFSGSTSEGANTCGYDLASPDAIYMLPDPLQEISGLTYLDKASVACIQDENGIIYIYDLISNQIQTERKFGDDGDYEGIAKVDNTIYVLRSDGNLFEIIDYSFVTPKVNFYKTNLPSKNNEGLCYDARNNRLLIAAKSKSGKGRGYKESRMVYEFALKTRSMKAEPVFIFDIQTIIAFADSLGIDLPMKKNKKGDTSKPKIKLGTSAIGIHPVTGKLYLLSATDYLLFIFNMDGNVEHVEQLDPNLFNKAEGITFNEEGDLFISNEGEGKRATILQFSYHGR
ncbi:MAG: hypothetical protein JRL30_19835 [Deltaproteobacteria bacterium]|nr:hypothetical protein [Deltaproteobacteria bacterium]